MASRTITSDQAAAVLARAERVITTGQVLDAYDALAEQIEQALAGRSPVVLAAMVGGLIPAAQLLTRMEMQLEMGYLHATRYRGGTRGFDVEWVRAPDARLAGRDVLIVDDILDEGHTLAAMMEAVRGVGVASVRSAVLVEKRHPRRAPDFEADFVGLEVPDRYVFGCGMDYKGWHRQLPAIYAAADEDA